MKTMLQALAGQPTKTPPFWLMRQAGRYLPEYRAVREQAGSFLDLCYNPELATEVTLQPIRRYGMDAAILFSDILVVPHALGQQLDYLEGEGPRLGDLPDLSAVTAGEIEPVLARLGKVFEAVGLIRAALPKETTLIGFAGAPWTVACYMVSGGGDREWAKARAFAYQKPEEMRRLLDVLVDVTAAYCARQVSSGAEVIQLFESWAGVLPEGEFAKWVVGPTTRLVAKLRAMCPGVPIIGFPRGAGLLTEGYAEATGVDGVGMDWTVPVAWAAKTLQPKWTVQGNLDPVALLAGGSALTDTARRLIETLGGRRYIFNLGHGVMPNTPPEHVDALAAVIRKG